MTDVLARAKRYIQNTCIKREGSNGHYYCNICWQTGWLQNQIHHKEECLVFQLGEEISKDNSHGYK